MKPQLRLFNRSTNTLLLACLLFTCPSWITAHTQTKSNQELEGYIQVRYRDLIRNLKEYEHKRVAVSASYRYGFEWQELFCLECRDQGKTWLEVTEKNANAFRRALRTAPRDHGIINATFYGILDGSNGPYGDGGYAYQFEVELVKDVKVVYHDGRVPELLPAEVQKQLCQ
jgi:hypothetical protein